MRDKIKWKEDEAKMTIKNAIRKKKIQALHKRMACVRIARNPIVDKYLMRQVYIPRLSEALC